MSFNAKTEAVFDLELKVKELCLTANDTQVFDANSGNGKIMVGEPVAEVRLVLFTDDSAGTTAPFAASTISVSGNDITVTGLALAANDSVIVKYVVEQS